MAEAEQTKKAIVIYCDCGAVIRVSKNSEGELICKSTYKHKDENNGNNREAAAGQEQQQQSAEEEGDFFSELIK